MLSAAAFDSIESSASADSISVWAEEEEHARREPVHDVTIMDIYDIKMERCEFDCCSSLLFFNDWLQPLLGQKYFLN
jgi:hypothetical protein